MRRNVVTAVGVLAVMLAGCGAGAEPGGDATTSTVGQVPVTSAAPATSLAPGTTTTTPSTTTTLPRATTTAVGSPATTTPPPAEVTVVPYFLIDEPGHPGRTGPFLVPVARRVSGTKAIARASLEQLFAGPDRGEQEGVPGMSTAIPAGVTVLGLTISDPLAKVDLSSEFDLSDDSAVVAQRVAQVVFTLSRFPNVQDVLFMQEGSPVPVPLGNGQLVSRPVNIGDYLEFAAAIHVESPVFRGEAGNPLQVSGFGAVFEASFNYALTDSDGLIITEGLGMTTNGTGWGGFDLTVDYEVDREQVGALIVWAHSAQDGSRIDVREYPVTLVP